MIKDLVKKSSYDIVFSFIYSFPLNPLFFFSFEQLVWHSISFKRAGIKIKIFIEHKFGSWTFFIHNQNKSILYWMLYQKKAKVSSEMMSHWTNMSRDPVMYKHTEFFQVNKKMSKGKQCASPYFVTSS